jgi:hypothetical protein
LEPNSKLASKFCRAYKRHVKKGGFHLPFRKEFKIDFEKRAYPQEKGTNVCGFCVMDFMFHFIHEKTYDEQKIEVT